MVFQKIFKCFEYVVDAFHLFHHLILTVSVCVMIREGLLDVFFGVEFDDELGIMGHLLNVLTL